MTPTIYPSLDPEYDARGLFRRFLGSNCSANSGRPMSHRRFFTQCRVARTVAVCILCFPNEADDAFRERAERAAAIARVLIHACFENNTIQQLLRKLQMTENAVRRNPTVRVEYEQAIAIGGIGETLAATRGKSWGDGPWIMPLRPDDEFIPERITYLYRKNSLYNRRFEQRIRLKELLGKTHRKLVGEAKYFTKELFLRRLTEQQAVAIRRILIIDPGIFWRAAKGKTFLNLPNREFQREFDFSPD